MRQQVLGLVGLLVILFALVGAQSAWAGNLTVKVVKVDKSEETKTAQASLQAALTGYTLSEVASLEISAGEFQAADWDWLRQNRTELSALAHFTITDELTSVADMQTSYGSYNYFNGALQTVSVAKANKITSRAFEDLKGLTKVAFPDAAEVESSAFKAAPR